MGRLTLTVAPEQAGRTVESLMRRELSMAAGQISSAKFRPDGIMLDGVRVRVNARVKAGSVLSVDISDRGRNDAPAARLAPSILYEDEHLAVLDKPAGVAVYGAKHPTVAGICAEKWGEGIAFHPVNRLDVGTSGLMVIALDGYTHDRLRRLLHTDSFIREYLAVVQGAVLPESGSVTLPISRRPAEGTRHSARNRGMNDLCACSRAPRAVDPDGLPSRTDYETVSCAGDRSLLRLRLYTGRTHQIRVHMAALGFPLVGDALYGAQDLALPRPALHSHRLRLIHPLTREALELASPLPEDMAELLQV